MVHGVIRISVGHQSRDIDTQLMIIVLEVKPTLEHFRAELPLANRLNLLLHHTDKVL